MLLYSGPLSLFSKKVEIAVAEKGLKFERILVPFSQTAGYAPKHEAVLKVNPKGQVPVLIDGDLTLYDSTVIFEYLEDTYPEPPLYPHPPRERARCRLMELEADEVLLQPVRKLMYRTEPPSPDAALRSPQDDEAAGAEILIARSLLGLDHRLRGNEYLCGKFSAADIATFMIVHWSLRLGGPRIDRLLGLSRWYARLMERPSVAMAVAEIQASDKMLSHPVPASRKQV